MVSLKFRLVFAPATGFLYSNFAFDMLAVALAHAANKPYEALLKETVLDPAGLKDTVMTLRPGDATSLSLSARTKPCQDAASCFLISLRC